MDLIKLLQEKEISASLRQSLLALRIVLIHSNQELHSKEIKKIHEETKELVDYDRNAPVTFAFNTGGGVLGSGSKLARYISTIPVTIGICGPYVGSLGAILFTACRKKIVTKDSNLFFHPNHKKIDLYPDSKWSDMRIEFFKARKLLQVDEPILYQLLSEVSHKKISVTDARSICRQRSLFSGQQIVDYELADELVEAYPIGINPE